VEAEHFAVVEVFPVEDAEVGVGEIVGQAHVGIGEAGGGGEIEVAITGDQGEFGIGVLPQWGRQVEFVAGHADVVVLLFGFDFIVRAGRCGEGGG